MGNTLFFISSRSCGNKEAYKNWLLFHNSNVKPYGTIKLSLKNQEVDVVYDQLLSNIEDWQNRTDLSQDVKDVVNAIPDIASIDLDQEGDIKKNIEQYLSSFRELLGDVNDHLDGSSIPVYKYPSSIINLFAVSELTEEQTEILSGKKWCDVVIEFLLALGNDVSDYSIIHLLLHDKDVPNYSSNSITHIPSLEECKNQSLISDSIYNRLADAQVELRITFFKHDNPLVCKIIGEDVNKDKEGRILDEGKFAEKFNKDIKAMLEQSGEITSIQKIANNLW